MKKIIKEFRELPSEERWGISILLIVITTMISIVVWFMLRPEYKCQGTVVEKYRTEAGYKIQEQKHVVFHCDSLNRNIDVEVTNNCYANTYVGEVVVFHLTYDKIK